MVQPRVEWSIVGSAVRRSAIGLRVSYISSLSLSLSFSRKKEHPSPPPPTVLVSRTTMDERSTVCPGCRDSSLLHNRRRPLSRAVCALPRFQPAHASFNDHSWNGYPLWFRSRARYLLVERHGSSFFVSITVSYASPPCPLLDTWNIALIFDIRYLSIEIIEV